MSAFNKIRYWVKNYAPPGNTDQRAVQAFVDVEPMHEVKSLSLELQGIAKGRMQLDSLEGIIGKNRAQKYGGLQEWSKMMLLWLADARRKS